MLQKPFSVDKFFSIHGEWRLYSFGGENRSRCMHDTISFLLSVDSGADDVKCMQEKESTFLKAKQVGRI